MIAAPSVHEQVALRLAGHEQRYTQVRQALVATLADAGRPLSIPEILATNSELPQSSAYRNITSLIEAGVVRRVTGVDDHGRFELAEELAGHHHHLACRRCGKVEDVAPSARLERAMAEAARVVAEEQGYEVTGHQFDLVGGVSAADLLPVRAGLPDPPRRPHPPSGLPTPGPTRHGRVTAHRRGSLIDRDRPEGRRHDQ